jgi:LysM domain-containing protein
MRQHFSTWLKRAAATVAATWLLASPAFAADPIQLATDAPSSYTVQKGDTLWAISGRFLRDPWRWPEIWGLNRDQIRNPHWIYPGDVVVLDRLGPNGSPRLSIAGRSGARETVRLSPTTRVESLDVGAVPSIPVGDIGPYLTRALVTSEAGLANSGEIVAGRDRSRVVRGQNDRVYAVGLDPKAGDTWFIYRPGKALYSPDTHEVLGFENRYIGSARVDRYADVSTLTIVQSVEEVFVGDRLVPVPRETLLNYVPHAPDKDIRGRIIASYHNESELGRGAIVTIDKGLTDGVELGDVMAVYHGVPPIVDPRPNTSTPQLLRYLDQTTYFTPDHYLQVPEERTGLMFVFRAFDRVSYALLVNTTDPVVVGDVFRKP